MLTSVVVNSLLLALLFFTRTPLEWTLVLVIWTNMLLFCLRQIRSRIYLFAFLIAFFIFLMGRGTLEYVFHYQAGNTTTQAFHHLVIVISVGLLSMWLAYWLWSNRHPSHGKTAKPLAAGMQPERLTRVRNIALALYYVSVPGAFVLLVQRVLWIRAYGYASMYTEESRVSLETGLIGTVLEQLTYLSTASLMAFLASMPTVRQIRFPVGVWTVFLSLSLMTGQRSTFVAGGLSLVCYLVVRARISPDEGWPTKRTALLGGVLVVPIVGVLAMIGNIRWGQSEQAGALQTLIDFFYAQGVSATVVTNGFLYRSAIPDQIYSLEFLHNGILARILGLTVYSGNSIDRAIDGGSFTHSFAYVMLGDTYVAGQGTGSSFLAEGFQDWGYLGVIAFGLIYGIIVAYIDQIGQRRTYVRDALRLISVQSVLWAPRASATGIVSLLIAPSTLFVVAVALFLTAQGPPDSTHTNQRHSQRISSHGIARPSSVRRASHDGALPRVSSEADNKEIR